MEHKPKKKKRGLVRSLALRPPVSSTAGSIARTSHFLWMPSCRGNEVLYDRSRSGRPYPIPEAGTPGRGDRVEHKPKKKKRGLVRSLALRPSVSYTAGSIAQDFPFPLDLYPIARQEGIQREKVWSCPLRQDRAVHRRSEACMAGAQLTSLPRQEGIQREKVWSCPLRQDRAVHRRSEACMAGAQLTSLPWLTVDSFGLPPPFPPPFSFGCS